jgi:hypothetical protein
LPRKISDKKLSFGAESINNYAMKTYREWRYTSTIPDLGFR